MHQLIGIGKEKDYVVRYLVVVSIATGHFIWYFGPYKGASNDLTLVYASDFLTIRENGEFTLGDGIFACMLYGILRNLCFLLMFFRFTMYALSS